MNHSTEQDILAVALARRVCKNCAYFAYTKREEMIGKCGNAKVPVLMCGSFFGCNQWEAKG